MALMASDDDHQFARRLFARDSDSGEEEDIAEHAWTCPLTGATLVYHLAFQAPGHGDSLWNASPCIAQHLLSPDGRSMLFGKAPGERRRRWPPRRCIEFGAGAALPSLALLKEGAKRAIVTDRFVNEETFEALRRSVDKNAWGWGEEETRERVAIMPHTWGEGVEELTRNGSADGDGASHEKADLLIASDCIYNPTYHRALLQSAVGAMDADGIFVVAYSFHGNVPKSQTLNFFEVAKEEFRLEIVNEFTKEYRGQSGIGNNDKERGAVHVKVLALEK